jgi:hypothetical protein
MAQGEWPMAANATYAGAQGQENAPSDEEEFRWRPPKIPTT